MAKYYSTQQKIYFTYESPVFSDITSEFITRSIAYNKRTIITGLSLGYQDKKLFISKGTFIKDGLVISFEDNLEYTTTYLNLSPNTSYYVIIDYVYHKDYKTPIAEIKFLDDSFIDIDKKIILGKIVLDINLNIVNIDYTDRTYESDIFFKYNADCYLNNIPTALGNQFSLECIIGLKKFNDVRQNDFLIHSLDRWKIVCAHEIYNQFLDIRCLADINFTYTNHKCWLMTINSTASELQLEHPNSFCFENEIRINDSLNSICNVNIAGPSNNEVLLYDNGVWINQQIVFQPHVSFKSFLDTTDYAGQGNWVVMVSHDEQILYYSDLNCMFSVKNHEHNLISLSDTNIDNVTSGNALVYNSNVWTSGSLPCFINSLECFYDTDFSNLSFLDLLAYDSSREVWTNVPYAISHGPCWCYEGTLDKTYFLYLKNTGIVADCTVLLNLRADRISTGSNVTMLCLISHGPNIVPLCITSCGMATCKPSGYSAIATWFGQTHGGIGHWFKVFNYQNTPHIEFVMDHLQCNGCDRPIGFGFYVSYWDSHYKYCLFCALTCILPLKPGYGCLRIIGGVVVEHII